MSLIHFINLYHSLGKFNRRPTGWYFSYFSQKIGFDISYRQFAWNVKAYFMYKNMKNIFICCLLKFLPSMLSIKKVHERQFAFADYKLIMYANSNSSGKWPLLQVKCLARSYSYFFSSQKYMLWVLSGSQCVPISSMVQQNLHEKSPLNNSHLPIKATILIPQRISLYAKFCSFLSCYFFTRETIFVIYCLLSCKPSPFWSEKRSTFLDKFIPL